MEPTDKLPVVRALDVTPFHEENGELRFALRDSSQIAPNALALSMPGYFVLAHFDGENTLADVQAAFRRQFGAEIAADDVQALAAALDDALMLYNERFERAYYEARDAYLAADARDNRSRWPDAETLRAEIRSMLGDGNPPRRDGLAGIIAPHLDYGRGAPCYADAYNAIARGEPAGRYVILGTNHFGRSRAVCATGKDFLTPLGRVAADRDFLERLEQRIGRSLREDEFDHNAEHSVELQVHVLQSLWPDASFKIVPVLCPDPSSPYTAGADEGVTVDQFADALCELIAEDETTTFLIAGADLSHIGQQFGDSEPTTPEFLERVGASDRGLLELLQSRREEEFVERVRATHNETRICSVGCIYTLLRAIPDTQCRVLRYHQAVNMPSETHVTCAAALISQS